MSKNLSVGLVTWNSKKLLQKSLKRNFKEAKNNKADFYVFDNGSVDGTTKYIKKNFPQIKVFSSPANLGFAAGHNYLTKLCNSKYYFCLNPDVYLAENHLSNLVSGLEKKKGFAAQGVLYSWNKNRNKNEVDSLGLKFLPNGKVVDIKTTPPQKTSLVQGCTGAAVVFDTKKFLSYGGFNESFFAYKEDVYLSLVAKKEAFYLVPSAEAWHMRNTKSIKKRGGFQNYLSYRNHFSVVNFGIKNGFFNPILTRLREHLRQLFFFVFFRIIYKQVRHEKVFKKY